MSVNALAILFEAFANREIDPSKPIQQSIGFPKERKENNRQDLNMKFSFWSTIKCFDLIIWPQATHRNNDL